jgi:hypothetical protein
MKRKIDIIISYISVLLFINIVRKIGVGLIWKNIKNIAVENFLVLYLYSEYCFKNR